jgi:eukaryotic-like serine/threonine-protein kinase
MESARWKRIQALFHGAADLPEGDQEAFLQSACGDDRELMSDVLAMLREDGQQTSLLDQDVACLSREILDDDPAGGAFQKNFGPYRIVRSLGEGGMGVVYLGERRDLGNLVAIKVLRDAWLSPARRERFLSEQRTLAQLNHPYIARLYDADTLEDGTPWFVMEYVEGVQLNEYCSQHPSSVRERLRLFRAVCEAVHYAHQNAVIHRDLKPSNILVRPDSTVRLLDFGIAKQMESLDRPVDQTRTGLRLMTPAYASPEQIRGERVGVQTDVYSLGVVLYELLTGNPPFDLSRSTPLEAERMVIEREPEKPSVAAQKAARDAGAEKSLLSESRSARADLDVLCLTALHKDTARRYSSVEALIRDIDHFLKGEPLDARPDTLRYRMGKFIRRNQRGVAAAAAVLGIVVAMAVFFTVRLEKARNAALKQAARTERIQQFMLNLFEGGDKEEGPAEELRVVTLLDRGAAQARSLDGEPQVQADLFQTLGNLYERLGKPHRADSLLHSALVLREKIYGPESSQVADSLVAIGQLRIDQARLDEAGPLIRQGLEMSKRTLPAGDLSIAKATAALGRLLEERGKYGEAIQVLDGAVKQMSRSGKETPELSSALSELANTHFYAGHYDESNALNQRVLEMDRRLYGNRHPSVANDLFNLGAIQFQWGRYSQAEKFYRQGLEIDRDWYGNDSTNTAADLTMLGRALVYEDKTREGTQLLERALVIQEKVHGEVHPSVASALNDLGGAAIREKDYAAAEKDFQRMEDIEEKVYGEHHYLVAIARANLATAYLKEKKYARAESLFRDCVKLFTETLSPTHMQTAITRIKLGRTLLREHRYREAEEESSAGYEILSKETSPSVSWLEDARQDLQADYAALNQPMMAAKFRAELAKNKSNPSTAAKKQ